jgi:hypothetical protein
VVLGASTLEESAGVTRAVLVIGLLLMAVLPAVHPTASGAEDPVAELTRAIQSLGPPGLLWGRLAVEEESPDGPTTPLVGVEVVLYPYVPSVVADLARIRESARGSGTEYESAVARLQERLKAFEAQVVALGPRTAPAAPGASRPDRADAKGPARADAPRPAQADASKATPDTDHGLVRRRTTDSSGIFVVGDLPSGEWLVVVFRLTPYSQPKETRPRSPSKKRGGGGELGGFLTRPAIPAKEAEVWVTRVRLAPGDRARAVLTDRTRFMVGPLRQG